MTRTAHSPVFQCNVWLTLAPTLLGGYPVVTGAGVEVTSQAPVPIPKERSVGTFGALRREDVPKKLNPSSVMNHPISSLAVSPPVPHSSSRERLATPTNRRQPELVHGARLIACLDSLAAVVALLAVLISVNLPNIPGGVDGFLSARITVKNVLLLILLATAWPLIFHVFGLYEAQHVRRLRSEFGRLVAATTAGTGLALLFPLTSATGTVTVSDLPHFWVTSLALCLLVRIGRRAVERARHRQVRRTLVIGTGRLAQRAHKDIHLARSYRYQVVGFVDEPTMSPSYDRICQPMIGTLVQLEQILMREVIDDVVIALPVKSCYQQIQHVISVCERTGVRAKYGADMFESTVASPRYDANGDRAVGDGPPAVWPRVGIGSGNHQDT